MSILTELKSLISGFDIDVFVVDMPKIPPSTYALLTPMGDYYDLYGDGKPHEEINSVRISVYTVYDYISLVRNISKALLLQDFYITNREFVGVDIYSPNKNNETAYYHYSIDIEKIYAV